MTQCPVCHENYKRLDVHLKMRHKDQPAQKPVYKQTSSQKAKLTQKVRVLAPSGPLVQPLVLADIKEACDDGCTPAVLKAIVMDTSWERAIDSMPFSKKPLMSTKWMIIAIIGIVALLGVLYFLGVLPGA
jgi:hypothetical protein